MFVVYDECTKYYRVPDSSLEDAIELIKRYENHIYDLYGGDTWSDMDTWGWWNYGEYKQIDISNIGYNEEINDLTNYQFTYPAKFCDTFKNKLLGV